MKRAYRRAAFLVALAVFLAAGPLLALYAIGYRWPAEAGDPQAVGVLLVESIPRRAKVYINGQLRGSTPQAIANLPPGSVEVVVQAEGYQPYRKQLQIASGQITEARTIRLIPAALESRRLMGGVQRFSLAPNRRALAVVQAGRLSVIDADGTVIMPSRALLPPQSLLWSPDSTRVLVHHPGGAMSTVNLADGALQALPSLAGAAEVVWDPRVPGRLLALLPDGRLIAHHVATRQSEVVAAGITTFDVSTRSIYAVDTQMRLHQFTLQAEELDVYALPPQPEVSRLLITPAGRVALLFADGTLSLLTEQRELLPVASGVQRAGWSPDGQLLHLQTDLSSVHVYNAADERHASIKPGQQQLVTRLARPLRDVQWFAGGGYLVFQVDDEIMLAEVDTRDHSHAYTIDSTNLGQSQAEVGDEGRQLFYLKQQDGETYLVSTPLLAGSAARLPGIEGLR